MATAGRGPFYTHPLERRQTTNAPVVHQVDPRRSPFFLRLCRRELRFAETHRQANTIACARLASTCHATVAGANGISLQMRSLDGAQFPNCLLAFPRSVGNWVHPIYMFGNKRRCSAAEHPSIDVHSPKRTKNNSNLLQQQGRR